MQELKPGPLECESDAVNNVVSFRVGDIICMCCASHLSLSLYQLPTVYSPLFDAIGAIADECCVCLEKLYHAQGTVPRRGEGGTTL